MAGVDTANPLGSREADSRVAVEVKALQGAGQSDAARERFAELVTRHQRRAVRIGYHYLRDAADADEAVQDAFMKAYTSLSQLEKPETFGAWIKQIARNKALDYLRARKRRRITGDEALEGAADDGMDAGEAAGQEERQSAVQRALATLDEGERVVAVRVLMQQMPMSQVAKELGLSTKVVKARLQAARAALMKMLGQHDEQD